MAAFEELEFVGLNFDADVEEGGTGGAGGEIKVIDIFSLIKMMDITQSDVSASFRVRQVIPHLPDTTWFIEQDIIHDLTEFNIDQIKRYPPWVYKEVGNFLDPGNKGKTSTFTSFGVFVEVLVKRAIYEQDPTVKWLSNLDSHEPNEFKDPQTSLYDIYRHVVKSHTGKDIAQVLPITTFNKSQNFFTGLIKGARDIFEEFIDTKMEFNAEIKVIRINPQNKTKLEWVGHPDIIGEDYVIDIKCVTNFETKAVEHYLQVLSYYAIANRNKRKIRYVGIFLPLQRGLIYVDLNDWDDRRFVQEVFVTIDRLRIQCSGSNILLRQKALFKVGSHIGRKDREGKTVPLIDNIRRVVQHSLTTGISFPIQIYIGGNQAGANDTLFGNQTIMEIRELVVNFGLPLYIHGPLNINSSSTAVFTDGWGAKRLKRELDIGYRIGARGVVIHVGKAKTFSEEKSMDMMEEFIRSCLDGATEECPLILETPAGQGDELCRRFSDFAQFYSRFSEEEKKKFKICIDTCHVFAAGYEPSSYIKKWISTHGPASLRLVHFNDSKKPKGCCVDRHAPCGYGYIGAVELGKVRDLCDEQNIHMVSE